METDAAVISAFDEIFGQALMPLGFVRAKLKLPYYIRLINNEIIHIIGMREYAVRQWRNLQGAGNTTSSCSGDTARIVSIKGNKSMKKYMILKR